jgi:signal peptidase II
VAVTDQVSKALAVAALSGAPGPRAELGPFRAELVRNSGVAFGLGRDWPVLISLITIAAAGATVVATRAGFRVRHRSWALALGLIAGGAVGNGVDRLVRSPGPLRGAVIDWITASGRGPVFNLADVALGLGALLTAILLARGTVRTARA